MKSESLKFQSKSTSVLPGVSIITPTWNRVKSIKFCLESVSRLNPAPLEHLVVDNCSDDGTEEVVRDYARRASYPVHYIREKDRGMYDAQNKGVRASKGTALMIMNDDDEFHQPDILEKLSLIQRQTNADIVFGDLLFLNPETGKRTYRANNQMNRWTLVQKGIAQQAILYTREAFEKVGLFDDSYRIAGDYEWLLRGLITHRISAAYYPFPVALFRLGGISNSSDSRDSSRNERQRVILSYYTSEEAKRAGRYRKTWRKFPFATMLCDRFYQIRLNIQKVKIRGDKVRRVPRSIFD